MTNKTATVGLGVLINTGNYENIKIDLGFTDDVQPDETHEDAIERLWDSLGQILEAKIREAKEDIGR